jgi:hypothetical protein
MNFFKNRNKPEAELEDDVVLMVENLSKKFCRKLKKEHVLWSG